MNLSSIPAQLLLQAVLILINAFFAATEIAVLSEFREAQAVGGGGRQDRPEALKLVEEPSGFLSTIQVGITLAGYLGSAFAAENFSGYFVSWVYDGLGFRPPGRRAERPGHCGHNHHPCLFHLDFRRAGSETHRHAEIL